MVVLETVLVFLIGASLVFYIWCAICTIQFFATRPSISIASENCVDRGVSILIPICGLDADARENWESFCHQNYENYEVIFGVKDYQDPAIPIIQEIVANYPQRAKLICGLEALGINYQVSNLVHLLEAAKHETVIFIDSDMRLTPDYLTTVTLPLADKKVGVVTCAYIGHNPQFFGSALTCLGRCIDFIPSVLIARSLDDGLKFSLGATIATRKSVLEKIGGLQQLLNRIASDYYIGKMVSDAGYHVELSRYVLETDSGKETVQQIFRRELRWAIGIRLNRGWEYYGMVFCYGTVYCLALLLVTGVKNWAIILSLTTLIVRLIQAVVVIHSIDCPKLIKWIWILPIRDLMSFIIWLVGAFSHSIYWRGRRLQVQPGGFLRK